MSKPYWHCPTCNGNFDPGELCDCPRLTEEHRLNKQKIRRIDVKTLILDPTLVEDMTMDESISNKLKIRETLILGIDISGGEDISCIQVVKVIGDIHEIVRTIYGEEADKTYDILMNRGGVIKV